jgi:acetoin utilization deacetylase AcuC-like enzyme
MNAIALALLISFFAVFLAFYYFAAAVQAASHVPQEQSLLCAVATARNITAASRTVGFCVYNGTHVIYLSP